MHPLPKPSGGPAAASAGHFGNQFIYGAGAQSLHQQFNASG
ncbi:MAG: hypothetical protein SF162_12125 [bacterium]|nr:hypothetical protein [bacterium]